MTALTLLGDQIAANNFGDTRSGGLAGPMGLFVITLLAIGTVLLIRNMNKRLRRLPDQFPPPNGATPADAGGTAAPDPTGDPVAGNGKVSAPRVGNQG
jgi:hypothetical protein